MRKRLAVLIIASWLFSVGAASPAPECLVASYEDLIDESFSGSLVCSARDASFEFTLVGRTAGDRFAIYDYRYRYLPPNGNVMHGGQKIVIFQNGKYLGQYSLSPPPYNTLSVNGTSAVIHGRNGPEIFEIDLSRNPPSEAFVDGEIILFYR